MDEGAALYVRTANELIHASEAETWQWLADNGMTVIPAEEIDLESIKSSIMSGIAELSADWDPCCLEICESTRPAQ